MAVLSDLSNARSSTPTFDPIEAAGYGAFVEAAYAAHAPDESNLKPDIVLPAGWKNAAWVTMRDFPPIGPTVERFYGYIATQEDGPGVVLALRGTVGWMEWYDDFVITFQPFKSGALPTGLVSTGFARIYSTLLVYDVEKAAAATRAGEAFSIGQGAEAAPSFAAAVAGVVLRRRPASATEAAAPTVVVGHSLGAALVTLYALENAVEGHLGSAVVYTFGSPRVGDKDFAAAYNNAVPTTWRIANNADKVPDAPFDILGYQHVDTLQQLDSTGKAKSSPGCAHAMSTYRYLLDGTTDLGDCAPAKSDEALLVTVGPVTSDPRAGLHAPASTTLVSNLTPADIAEIRRTVDAAPPNTTVPSARVSALASTDARPTALDYERIMGENDLLDINWFERGTAAGKSVCRIILRDGAQREVGYGTGFLVGPGVVLTNHHVLEDAATAASAIAEFGYEFDIAGNPKPTARFALQPDRFFFTSPQDVLDFSFVAVAPVDSVSGRSLSDFGWLRLNGQVGKVTVAEWVSIIQHPSGLPKQVAARENQLLKIADTTLLYATDTAPGSSGSPVFNDSWQVVALHHSGVPDTDAQGNWLGPDGRPAPPNPTDAQVRWLGNEGIRVSLIVSALRSQPAHPLRDLVLRVCDGQAVGSEGSSNAPAARRRAPGRATARRAGRRLRLGPGPSCRRQREPDDDEVVLSQLDGRIVVTAPLAAVVQMRFRAGLSVGPKPAGPLPAPHRDEAASEKLVIDPAYDRRKGYDPDFLAPNGSIPQPGLKPSARRPSARTGRATSSTTTITRS